jgi:hypothetical protein
LYRPASGLEGCFKFRLSGTENVAVKVPVNLVLPHESLAGLELHGQFLPGHHIALTPNSTCSPWVDIEDLINSQDVDVYDQAGQPCHDRVLDLLTEARAEHPNMGKKLDLRFV